MIIKSSGQPKSLLSELDLLGRDEKALSKSFAYLLGTDSSALFTFLSFLKIKIKHSNENFRKISINIEVKKAQGRTDIEIKFLPKFHIVIETKINKNKVHRQKTQYLKTLDLNASRKILCFITQERDYNKQLNNEIEILYLGWQDINNIYSDRKFKYNSNINNYNKYVQKNFSMKQQKEILVQDLSDSNEIKRFKSYHVYRRPESFGTPLYFAPHFTRQANQTEGIGISYLSKIMGVLTISAKNIEYFEGDLRSFSSDEVKIKNWMEGVRLGNENELFTYFFLDNPIRLKNNLQKDGGIKKNRGKNWIAAMIPPNRCVSFQEFIKRINDNV